MLIQLQAIAESNENVKKTLIYLSYSIDQLYSYTDRDYIDDTNFTSYRESGSGPSAGLRVIIDISKDDYVSYGQTFYGVSVYVHAKDSFPLPGDKVLVAQPATDVLLAVKPTVLGSSTDIRGLPVSIRNCFFKNEVLIGYFIVIIYLAAVFTFRDH